MDLEEAKNEIKNRLSIVELVSRYVILKPSGSGSFMGLCPFHHEKTPSFNVSEKGFFHCFGCHKNGDIFTFLMEMEKYSFIDAIKKLAQEVGVELTPSKELSKEDKKRLQFYDLYKRLALSLSNILLNKPEAKFCLDYLTKRALNLHTIQEYQLGYMPSKGDWLYHFLKKQNYSDSFLAESGLFSKKNLRYSFFSGRLIFPIFDSMQRVIAFSARSLNPQEKYGKYLNSPDTLIYRKSNALFGIHKANDEIRKKGEVYLVEGNFDVLSMHQAGIFNTVAPLGTAFTDNQASLLKKYAKKAFCCFDADSAGIKATSKACMTLLKNQINPYVIPLPKGSDPADLLKKEGEKGLTNLSKCSMFAFEFLLKEAISQHGVNDFESKEKVIKQLIPFIQLYPSETQKSEALKTLSTEIGVDFLALQRDFAKNRFSMTPSVSHFLSEDNRKSLKTNLPNEEILLLVAASTDVNLFQTVRGELKPKDFSFPLAKNLFVAMVDCYQHNTFTTESFVQRIEKEEDQKEITKILENKDFIHQKEKQIVLDTINRMKLTALKRRKSEILKKLNDLNPLERNSDATSDLLEEVQLLDMDLHSEDLNK